MDAVPIMCLFSVLAIKELVMFARPKKGNAIPTWKRFENKTFAMVTSQYVLLKVFLKLHYWCNYLSPVMTSHLSTFNLNFFQISLTWFSLHRHFYSPLNNYWWASRTGILLKELFNLFMKNETFLLLSWDKHAWQTSFGTKCKIWLTIQRAGREMVGTASSRPPLLGFCLFSIFNFVLSEKESLF